MNRDLESRFLEFVRAADAILRARTPPPSDDRVAAFVNLCKAGQVAVLEPIRRELGELKRRLRPLRDLYSQPQADLLAVAKLTYAEDPYTELVAWALDPRCDRQRGHLTQKTWLESLGIVCDEPFVAAIPETQVYIDQEIPDLLLNYEKVLVVVEAKTGTTEHTTVTGRYQTQSYPEAARKYYGLPDSHPTQVVYLTVDRSPAKEPKAKCTSYLQFASVLAEVAASGDLTPSDAWAFRMIATHFAFRAVPDSVTVGFVKQLLKAENLPDSQLLRGASAVGVLHRLLEKYE